MWHLIESEKRVAESIIYFKARVYLLQANCSRGSALEGCALPLEGGGPRGRKRACLSIRLYQNNTPWRRLLLRSEMKVGEEEEGGNKSSERWIRRERGRAALGAMTKVKKKENIRETAVIKAGRRS